MSSNPKIVVLKAREIIYTLILLFLAALLILCLVLMFTVPKDAAGSSRYQTQSSRGGQTSDTETGQTMSGESLLSASTQEAAYTPGIYTTPVTLGENTVDVEVTVDSNHINSIRLVNLSEVTTAAYPLVSPSLDHIASQILNTQSLDGITAPQENRYTSQLLLSAIAEALELASQ